MFKLNYFGGLTQAPNTTKHISINKGAPIEDSKLHDVVKKSLVKRQFF